MRTLPWLLGALVLAAPAAARAVECESSPYNCKVPNDETVPVKKDTNRKFNDFDQTYLWGLVNQPELKDGEGGVRGHVKGDTKINFGQRKSIGGVTHVYAFATGLVEGGTVSGWIAEDSVYRKNTLAKMPTVSPGKPDNGYYQTDWVVTGGDLNPDGSLALNAKYGNRKVNPNVSADENEAASDYLVRQWNPATRKGYINFLYNLPGVGGMTTDTLPMCVHFRRFKDVSEIEIELYFVDSAQKSDLSLHFDFGEIDGRRGWITKEMLTPADDLGKLAPGHPCRPADPPPGPGAGGMAGSPDPGAGGAGGDPGAGGSPDPGAGGAGAGGAADPGAGGAGDPGAGGAGDPGAGGAAGDSAAGAAGGSAAGGPAAGQGGAGLSGSSGQSGSGGASAGQGGAGGGGASAGSAGAKAGPGGASAGQGGATPEESSSDGGCGLSARPARAGGGLGLAVGMLLAARRRSRRG